MNTMKNLKLITITLFSLTILSCSSDDDNGPVGPTVNNNLYGTWNMLEYYEDIESSVDEIPCEEDLEYTFSSNLEFTKVQFSGEDFNNCSVALTSRGIIEIIDENTILLKPSISSQPNEEIRFQLRNNGQELRVFRETRTEEYRRP